MVSDEALKKLQEQIAAWPMTQRFVVQQLIEEYRRNREDLRAYEATGLTPEQCENAKVIIESAFSDDTSKAERIRELLKADKDGRLVVLPCKVGDTVYLIVTKRARVYMPEFRFIKKSKLTFLNMERILQDFGKTAFLTREEAEAALEAKQNG